MNIRLTKPGNDHPFTYKLDGYNKEESLSLACALLDEQGYGPDYELEVLK